MPRFRKKPVIIEAEQWFPADWEPHELEMTRYPSEVYKENGQYYINTLEGRHTVTPGDWIITGVKGERYPCKPDIFAMTYEAVD